MTKVRSGGGDGMRMRKTGKSVTRGRGIEQKMFGPARNKTQRKLLTSTSFQQNNDGVACLLDNAI